MLASGTVLTVFLLALVQSNVAEDDLNTGRYIKLAPNGHFFYCGRVKYNVFTQKCCNGKVLSRASKFTACCHDKVYESDRELCCQGDVLPSTPAGCDVAKVCRESPKPFRTAAMACCGGTLSPIALTSGCCGGIRGYDAKLEICCGASTHPRGPNTACCGTQAYDKTTQTCCVGTVQMKTEKCETNQGFEAECRKSPNLFMKRDKAGKIYACCARQLFTAKAVMSFNLNCCKNKFVFNQVIDSKRSYKCCDGMLRAAPKNTSCCGSKMYDRDRQYCCASSVLDFQPKANSKTWELSCCYNEPAGVVYNRSESVCCDNKLLPNPTRRTSCCDNKPFDYTTHTCCERKIIAHSSPQGCCRDTLYDKKQAVCCYPKLHYVKLGSGAVNLYGCCGETLIDYKNGDMCCGGTVLKNNKERSLSCCGTRAYNYKTQICCNQQIYDSSRHICCGRQGQSKVFKTNPKLNGCCGDKTFNYSAEFCCSGQASKSTPGNLCCAGKIVDTGVKTGSCCGVTGFDYTKEVCCNQKLYSKDKYLCCKGKLYQKTDKDTECCAAAVYNRDTQTCCLGVVNDRPRSGMLFCCGNTTYDYVKNEGCCYTKQNGYVVLDRKQSLCCGGKVVPRNGNPNLGCCGRDGKTYDREKELCCNDTAVQRKGNLCCGNKLVKINSNSKKCCGQDVFDDTTEICCRNRTAVTIYPRREDAQSCCNGKPFNSKENICCNNKVHTKKDHICCWSKLLPRKSATDSCCLGKVYDTKTEICCYRTGVFQVADRRYAFCCGKGVVHDSRKTFCCNNQAYPYETAAGKQNCCGKQIVNPDKDRCCWPNVAYGALSSTLCCGQKIHHKDPKLYSCCGNKNLYQPQSQMCCNNGVVKGKMYGADVTKQKC